ncbi:hypothetical protein E2C01_036963 [Portunus trituberculatus]|uniref:Uncharacterized protein n=1 Tax=Portunus trituberculatus TaxID=210409 RepID=A0A5B7FE35_PORTR|nr:hypothetical protein [Portunus trituberculatus]
MLPRYFRRQTGFLPHTRASSPGREKPTTKPFWKLPFVNTNTPSSVLISSAVTPRAKVVSRTATETPTLIVRVVDTVWDESVKERQDADVASRGPPPLLTKTR